MPPKKTNINTDLTDKEKIDLWLKTNEASKIEKNVQGDVVHKRYPLRKKKKPQVVIE